MRNALTGRRESRPQATRDGEILDRCPMRGAAAVWMSFMREADKPETLP